MAIDLTGTKIKDTYKQILHVDSGVNSSDKTVYDGDGTATGLKVSTAGVDVTSLKIAGSAVTASASELNALDGVSGTLTTTTGTQTLTNKTLTAPTVTSPAITGGSVNNTPVGAATPNTGAFTDLTASGTVTLAGTSIPTSSTLVTTTATQTLTGKTLSADDNTLSGLAASSFIVSNASGNIDGSAAQKVIPSGVVVGTTDTQTLTNKTLTSPTISGGSVNNAPIGAGTPNTGAFTDLSASGAVSFTGTGAAKLPVGTTGQRPTPAAGMLRFNDDTDEFEGYNGSAWSSVGGSAVSVGGFYKVDSGSVVFTKTGNGTASVKSGTIVGFSDGTQTSFTTDTAITMPTLVAGTDYAIWVKPDGSLEATSNHTSPPVANARKVGGFHYAPGSNATGTSGGDTTPQINEYSFWDLKWRPACPDPRGMTLVGGGFWSDIYLTGIDAITNGSSKYNVTMADGSSPPKVPTMFGGNGSTTYGSYTWFEAQELATAFGKRTFTQQEFMSAMYGTTEASSVGTDQGSTVLNAAYTSKWGVIQATGVLYVWGRDRGGPFAGASWNANTEGRGSEYSAPNAALFGGAWVVGSFSGSRCSDWLNAASFSVNYVGSRFAASHLQID